MTRAMRGHRPYGYVRASPSGSVVVVHENGRCGGIAPTVLCEHLRHWAAFVVHENAWIFG
jgi:hypothetical protein